MVEGEGNYSYSVDGEWVADVYDVDIEGGHSGVSVVAEAVGDLATEVVGYVGLAVDGEWFAFGAEWSEVVDASHVVVVAVG